MTKINETMRNKGSGGLTSEVLLSSNMDELLSGAGHMSTVMRSSVNPSVYNPGQAANIKKSIRGGAGSVYKKGPNQSVNLGELGSNRGASLHILPGENLQ